MIMARDAFSASGYRRTVCDTSNRTQVASVATATTILAANDSRIHVTVFNDSTATLYLAWGTTPTATNYTAKIPAQGMYELPAMPIVYVGALTGIWASANGFAYVTEVA